MPANTGIARAIHRADCFAGLPAPTSTAQVWAMLYLWVHDRGNVLH
jgi:hypothetical protein